MTKPTEVTTPTPTADEPENVSLDDVADLLQEMVADVEDEKPEETPPADKPEDTETPPPPATPDVGQLFQSPEAKSYMRGQFQTWLSELTAEQRQSAEAQEVQKLVDENNFEELGKRWAAQAQKKRVSDEVLEGFLDQTYRAIFADPVFQNLTPADVQELRPENFKSDADYIRHLSQFMAKKSRESGLDSVVEERVAQRITALKNEAAARKANAGSMGGAPPADARAPDKPTDARSLISEGLREAFKDAIPT